MNSLLSSPILASYDQSPWTANVAIFCIGVLWILALVRSQTNKGEGAH
jgi:hypothetical protein